MECRMYARTATVAITLALVGAVVAGAHANDSGPAVSCDRIVLRDRSGTEDGFRILLEAVSVPGARHLGRETSATRTGRWRWYRNAGLAIRAGTSSVRVSVPEGWRDRIALSWGGSRPASSIVFAQCPASAAGTWNYFAGGIHLSRRADCVPLQVTVGGTSTTVRVGVGRACGGL
jgi:hypothetical protein